MAGQSSLDKYFNADLDGNGNPYFRIAEHLKVALYPPHECNLWNTIGASLAMMSDSTYDGPLQTLEQTAEEAKEAVKERGDIGKLLRKSKGDASDCFYIYWAMLKRAMSTHFKVLQKHAANLKPDAAIGVMPLAMQMVALSNHDTLKRVDMLKQYELMCTAVPITPRDTLEQVVQKRRLLVQALFMNEGSTGAGKHPKLVANSSAIIKAEVDALLAQRRAWGEVEAMYKHLNLDVALTPYDTKLNKMMEKIEDFFKAFPVKLFTQNYEYIPRLGEKFEDQVTLLPQGDEQSADANPQLIQVNHLALSRMTMDFLPWEIIFVTPFDVFEPQDRARDQAGENLIATFNRELVTSYRMLRIYLQLMGNLRSIDCRMKGVTNQSCIALHVFGRFILEEAIHRFDERSSTDLFNEQMAIFTHIASSMGKASPFWTIEAANEHSADEFRKIRVGVVDRYVKAFFDKLESLMDLASQKPYACNATATLLTGLQLQRSNEEKCSAIIEKFYKCVKPVANQFLDYASSVENEAEYNALAAEVYQAINDKLEAGCTEEDLVMAKLRTADGHVLIPSASSINGFVQYNSVMSSVMRDRADLGVNLKDMVATIDERLPEIVKGIDLLGKFSFVMERVEEVKAAYANDQTPSEEDLEFVQMELEYTSIFRQVVLACVRARQYRTMTHMDEAISIISRATQGGLDVSELSKLLFQLVERTKGDAANNDAAKNVRIMAEVLRVFNFFGEILHHVKKRSEQKKKEMAEKGQEQDEQEADMFGALVGLLNEGAWKEAEVWSTRLQEKNILCLSDDDEVQFADPLAGINEAEVAALQPSL